MAHILEGGEGNGNPLQYSCLETPVDGGALVGSCPWGLTELGTTGATWHAWHSRRMEAEGRESLFKELNVAKDDSEIHSSKAA